MLSGDGDDRLKKTRYLWLYNSTEMPLGVRERFEKIRYQKLQTGKAWALKEMALDALSYVSRYQGRLAWNQWLNWADRCRLEPIRRVSRTIKHYFEGVLNAMNRRRSNARAEAVNAKIQKLKYIVQGFRNPVRFYRVILFHLGQLDLYPRSFPIFAHT